MAGPVMRLMDSMTLTLMLTVTASLDNDVSEISAQLIRIQLIQ